MTPSEQTQFIKSKAFEFGFDLVGITSPERIVSAETRSDPQKRPREPYGFVSRYARGRDYHRLLEQRLKHFVRFLSQQLQQEQPKFRYSVDYGPFLERAYAEAAGLGFIGKSGNLITRQFGTWVFLSQIWFMINL